MALERTRAVTIDGQEMPDITASSLQFAAGGGVWFAMRCENRSLT